MKKSDGTWTAQDNKRLRAERKARAWTTSEIADILKIPASTVRGLIQNGTFHAFQDAGKWYVDRAELDAYLAQKK